MQVGHLQTTEEESQWGEVVKGNTKDLERKVYLLRIMEIHNTGAVLTWDRYASSLPNSGAQAVNTFGSMLSTRDFESFSTFIDSGIHFRVCYSNNHATSSCQHHKEGTDRVRA